jgi:hypothetical protein
LGDREAGFGKKGKKQEGKNGDNMKTRTGILVMLMVMVTLSCSLLPRASEEESIYQNDNFSFIIPAGWGMGLFGGEYYKLGVDKQVDIFDDPITIRADAFFTVASSPLKPGSDLETRIAKGYSQYGSIWSTYGYVSNLQDFTLGTLSGKEISYPYPYGEGWYEFRDIWLVNDDLVYVLSFSTIRNEFENHREVFESILSSFRFINE